MGSTDEFVLPFLASQAGSPARRGVGRVLPHSIPKFLQQPWGTLSLQQTVEEQVLGEM